MGFEPLNPLSLSKSLRPIDREVLSSFFFFNLQHRKITLPVLFLNRFLRNGSTDPELFEPKIIIGSRGILPQNFGLMGLTKSPLSIELIFGYSHIKRIY